MESQSSINLISPQAKMSEEMTGLMRKLQTIGIVAIVALLICASVVLLSYIIVQQRYSSLTARRNALRVQIAAESEKEARLVTIHLLSGLTEKLFSKQDHWEPVVTRLNEIAPAPILSSITVDEKHLVSALFKTNTLEEVFPILASVISDVDQNKIHSPQIVSLQLDKEGKSNLVVSFIPSL